MLKIPERNSPAKGENVIAILNKRERTRKSEKKENKKHIAKEHPHLR